LREIVEVRAMERVAGKYFAGLGQVLGGSEPQDFQVRRVVVEMGSPEFEELRRIERELRAGGSGDVLFGGWTTRLYSDEELKAASVLAVGFKARFEPVGEECGTVYDESHSCTCGVGRVVEGRLRLNLGRVPKGRDFATSVAGERIVSERFADLIEECGLSGARLTPVEHIGKRAPTRRWFSLEVESPRAVLTEPTIVGNSAFDLDERAEGRCPLGYPDHVIGRQRISAAFVDADSVAGRDISESVQWVGVRRGYLMPERDLYFSRRAIDAVETAGLRGLSVEVANLTHGSAAIAGPPSTWSDAR
jgi:hypothetical protein